MTMPNRTSGLEEKDIHSLKAKAWDLEKQESLIVFEDISN